MRSAVAAAVISICITLAGCFGSDRPWSPDLSANITCRQPSDCSPGLLCCVSYTQMGDLAGGSSMCVPAGNCAYDASSSGPTITRACDTNDDCSNVPVAGSRDAGSATLSCNWVPGIDLHACN